MLSAMDGSDPDAPGYIRLRGIPFSATPDDILAFFEGLEPIPETVIIGTTREGRLSGEAFVQFPTNRQVKEAVEQRNRATMGDRYIELFPSTSQEAQRAANGEGAGGYGHQNQWDMPQRPGGGCGGQTYWEAQAARDRPVAPEEVEEFLLANGVDEHAAQALRDLPQKQQAAVIDRGGLGNARNPSSVLLSRIRDAQNPPPMPPPPPSPIPRPGAEGGKGDGGGKGHPPPMTPGMPLADRVEAFLEGSGVDAAAWEALRNCHPDVQEEVMLRGVNTARNPSSALVGRIRDAEAMLMGGGKGGGGGGQEAGPGHGALAESIEEFIRNNGIDDRAADTLRACHPQAQEMVLERGDLHGTRNPSSALLSRIRDAQGGRPPSQWGRPPDPNWGNQGGGYGGHQQGGPRSFDGLATAIEEFLVNNFVDESASEVLRSVAPEVQDAILQRGDLKGARNPSSALLARIKDVQGPYQGKGGGGRSPQQRPPPQNTGPVTIPFDLAYDLEFLLRIYAERDERAVDCYERLQQSKYGGPQDFHYDKGYGRGGPYHGGKGKGGPPPQPFDPARVEEQIDVFVQANGIDARAADTLRRADPRVQYMVMEKGVSGARNPSSALLARLRDAEAYVGAERAPMQQYEGEPPLKRGRPEDEVPWGSRPLR